MKFFDTFDILKFWKQKTSKDNNQKKFNFPSFFSGAKRRRRPFNISIYEYRLGSGRDSDRRGWAGGPCIGPGWVVLGEKNLGGAPRSNFSKIKTCLVTIL